MSVFKKLLLLLLLLYLLCRVLPAILAYRVGLCSRFPWCTGHSVDGTELGVG